jgi:hypothetical protein
LLWPKLGFLGDLVHRHTLAATFIHQANRFLLELGAELPPFTPWRFLLLAVGPAH